MNMPNVSYFSFILIYSSSNSNETMQSVSGMNRPNASYFDLFFRFFSTYIIFVIFFFFFYLRFLSLFSSLLCRWSGWTLVISVLFSGRVSFLVILKKFLNTFFYLHSIFFNIFFIIVKHFIVLIFWYNFIFHILI